MNKIKLAINTLLISGAICYSVQAVAGPFVEVRERFRTNTNLHQLKLGGGYYFENGAGVLISQFYNMGNDYQQFKHSFNEYEGWYPVWKSDDKKWRVDVGAQFDSDANGSSECGNIGFLYYISDMFTTGARYRYINMNHKNINHEGDLAYANQHQIDYYFNVKFNNQLTLALNPTYYYHMNDFRGKNDKNYHLEMMATLFYKMTDHWAFGPHVGWMDKDAADNRQAWLVGLTTRYYF